jgi:iodotyrosine deiodinase
MTTHRFIPYSPPRRTGEDMLQRAGEFLALMQRRRSVRHFSAEPVPRRLIEIAIETASTAPSGAHRQPWRFVAISDSDVKRHIRVAAEAEERENYEGGRMPPEWQAALAPLGTDWRKPFLEIAPWIVVLFEETYEVDAAGNKRPNYYVKESVGIACGLFLTAIHNAGLAALTHTPSPMAFLSRILNRPQNEKPYVLIPVGYPAVDATVPDLQRKPLDAVAVWKTSADDRESD